MSEGIGDSRFYMWRAVVAMIHADEVVKPHEVNFIFESTKGLPLSLGQRQMLAEDIDHPRDIREMFSKITHPRDKEDFFHLAQAVAWSDGDLDEREEFVLSHFKMQDIGKNAGDMALFQKSIRSFDEVYIHGGQGNAETSLKSVIGRLIGR